MKDLIRKSHFLNFEAEVKYSFSTWAFIAGLSETHSCSEIILLKWPPASFSHEILTITAKGKSNARKTCGLHYRLCILLTYLINVQIGFYIILNTTVACHHFYPQTGEKGRKREALFSLQEKSYCQVIHWSSPWYDTLMETTFSEAVLQIIVSFSLVTAGR